MTVDEIDAAIAANPDARSILLIEPDWRAFVANPYA